MCQFYLVTNVKCLHTNYNSWNFTLGSDLILDIQTIYSQNYTEVKMGYGLETRVVGSKIDSKNAMDDLNWAKGTKNKQARKKPKSRPQVEVDKKNVLGGEGGLLDEEFHQEKWQKEKVEAQSFLEERITEDRFMMENGHFDVMAELMSETIPEFDHLAEDLYCPDHIVQTPSSGKTLTIEHLLDNYFMTRMINNQDHNYQCPTWKTEVQDLDNTIRFVTKMFRLLSAPQYFAISLKRFKQISRGIIAKFEKNDTQVDYDLTLDLTKYFLSK